MNKQNTKIINGTNANYRTYPFFGILYIDNDGACGCSYIGGPLNAVITAAHCLVDENNIPLDKAQLKVGFLQSQLSVPNFMYNVSRVIIHPSYNNNTLDYDIAILLLSTKPNTAVRPLRIPTREQTLQFIRPGRQVEVIGYGLTCVNCNVSNDVDKSKKSAVDIIEDSFINKRSIVNKLVPIKSQVLRKGVINIINKKPSRYNFYLPEQLTSRMILAGRFNNYNNPNDNIDACQGDSGGPLLYRFNGVYQLIGLVSLGNGCGLTGYPGIYTYVNYFRNWIKQNTNLSYL